MPDPEKEPTTIDLVNALIALHAPGRALHSFRVENDAELKPINIILFLKPAE